MQISIQEKKKQWIKVKSPWCLTLLVINLEIKILWKRLALGFFRIMLHFWGSFILNHLHLKLNFLLFTAMFNYNAADVKVCVHYFSIFHQMIADKLLWKILFISSKKLFLFSRYSDFCISVLPSFLTVERCSGG